MTVNIPAAKHVPIGRADQFCISVPLEWQASLWRLGEAADAKGGYLSLHVALPGEHHTRPTENLLYKTARAWWIALGYDNVIGWRLAKLKFGVSWPYESGMKPARPGVWMEHEGWIHYVVSESDYTQDEASTMISRLEADCMERGIAL